MQDYKKTTAVTNLLYIFTSKITITEKLCKMLSEKLHQ